MLCGIAPSAVLRVRRPDIAEPEVDPHRPHTVSALRRRRAVVVGALVVGTAALAGTLAAPSDTGLFYGLGLLSAVAWIAGGLLSGPIPTRGRRDPAGANRDIVVAVLVGVALFVAFFAVSLVAARIPALSDSVRSVFARADAGPQALVLGVALINGIGEEVFFRGALQDASGGTAGPCGVPPSTGWSPSPPSTWPWWRRRWSWARSSASSDGSPEASSPRSSPT